MSCDASRQCAASLIGADEAGRSYFTHQPRTESERLDATRALLSCPTGSIGVEGGPRPELTDVFPLELAPGIWSCGYNARSAYGANAYFVMRPGGHLLIDGPRFAKPLVAAIEARGGLTDILLTHRDDIGDAKRFAEHFGARVWIHAADASAAPFATDRFEGVEPTEPWPGVRAIPVPGHTQGSVMFLVDDEHLFTGDSLYWSRTVQGLCAFRWVCWYAWPRQLQSLRTLLDVSFGSVFPGHGGRHRATADTMHRELERFLSDADSNSPRVIPPRNAIFW